MAHAEGKSAAELESDVAEERRRIGATLRELQDRLTPGQLVDEVLRYGRGAGGDLIADLGRTLSANAVPTALVGVGLLWLLLASRSPAPSHAASSPEPRMTSEIAGADPI